MQHRRIELEARIRFEDDVILIQLCIESVDLPLAEGIV